MIRKTFIIGCVMFGLFTNCLDAQKMVDLNKLVDVVAWYKNDKMDYKIGFLKDGRFVYQIIAKDSLHEIKTNHEGMFRIKKDTIFLMYRETLAPLNFTSYLIISPDTYFIQSFTNSNKLLFLRVSTPKNQQFKHI